MTTTRIRRAAVIGALLAATGTSATAGPAGDVRGSHDGALVTFEPGGGAVAVYIGMTMWGTASYDGIPPEEIGGLGDREVCIGIFTSDEQHGDAHINVCSSDIEFEIDRLRSARVEATIPVEVTRGDGTIIGSDTLVVNVLLEGEGIPFPGARAQLNTSPGVEAEYSWQRPAVVSGTVSSTMLSTIDLASAGGVLFADECRALMLGPDHSETCRF